MSHEINKPNKFLDTFINQIEGDGQLRILDVGCGQGDIALHLASLGHQVMGVSNDDEDIEKAQRRARRHGIGNNCTFETMDARDLAEKFDRGFFRAVLVSDMLHLMSKDDSTSTIESIKGLTALEGYNAIWGYVVDPGKSTSRRNIERMFLPGELHGMYDTDPNWRVIERTEEEFASTLHVDRERVGSHAGVIARKSPRA